MEGEAEEHAGERARIGFSSVARASFKEEDSSSFRISRFHQEGDGAYSTDEDDKKHHALAEGLLEFTEVITNLGNSFVRLNRLISEENGGIIKEKLRPKIREIGVKTETDEGFQETYLLDDAGFLAVQDVLEEIRDNQSSRSALAPMTLMNIVSYHDALMARLVAACYLRAPQSLFTQDKNIPLSELMKYERIEEAKERILDKEVESIMYKSHSDQLKWIENRIKKNVLDDMPDKSVYLEIFERRNLCAHGERRVNQRYLEGCRRIEYETDAKIGDDVVLDEKYIINSVRLILRYGVIISQYVWRNLYKSDNDAIITADQALRNIGKMLIDSDESEEAAFLFKWGYVYFQPSNEMARREFIVKHAGCFLGVNDDQAKSIINEYDWTAIDARIRVRVHAIMSEFEESFALMASFGSGNQVTPEEYLEDPEFSRLREAEGFSGVFEKIFGVTPSAYSAEGYNGEESGDGLDS